VYRLVCTYKNAQQCSSDLTLSIVIVFKKFCRSFLVRVFVVFVLNLLIVLIVVVVVVDTVKVLGIVHMC